MSNPLYSDKTAVKYGRDVYDKAPEDAVEFPYNCPEDMSWLCTFLTYNAGLCKRAPENCTEYAETDSELPISVEDVGSDKELGFESEIAPVWGSNCSKVSVLWETGTKGGSPIDGRLARSGREFEQDSSQESILPTRVMPESVISDEDPIESVEAFGVMTYDVMGMDKGESFGLEMVKLRMMGVCGSVRKQDPDIVCFQGVGDVSRAVLQKELGGIYENVYGDGNRGVGKGGMPSGVLIMSKYTPSRVTLYSLGDLLRGSGFFMVMEFASVVVFNVSMLGGSRYSGEKEWFHFSRCRKQQFGAIGGLVEKYVDNGKACILAGDFNCDLNGTHKNWPELVELGKMGARDSWKLLRKVDPGFTEDTFINLMKWNMGFRTAQFRYDGILFVNPSDNVIVRPEEVFLTGRKPMVANMEVSKEFVKYFVPKKDPQWELKVKYYNSEKKLVALFPSDRFAVMCKFRRVEERMVIESG